MERAYAPRHRKPGIEKNFALPSDGDITIVKKMGYQYKRGQNQNP